MKTPLTAWWLAANASGDVTWKMRIAEVVDLIASGSYPSYTKFLVERGSEAYVQRVSRPR